MFQIVSRENKRKDLAWTRDRNNKDNKFRAIFFNLSYADKLKKIALNLVNGGFIVIVEVDLDELQTFAMTILFGLGIFTYYREV